ncbi:FAD binding domain-containing protein [Apodospora peruviana]|uniref:FAD binding domain-containing protein n=1 Tax=Apodospora peruviana TaxID=516989 RepID=A0AAE0IK24_9PEZI|nr:FAD binding domain-containing protein [Apodospora peruviana]
MEAATPTADVVVVGGGLAGICAAIAAAEKGASVVVLDRAYGGGASAISGGIVYAGGGTRHQREAGYGDVDSPDNMFRYLREEVGDAADEATVRRFCDESVARMEWLESYGVLFGGPLCPFKTSYPKPEYGLFFSGNEKSHPYASLATPAPRGHRTNGKGSGGLGYTGRNLWQPLFDSALKLGVKFEPASRVEALITHDSQVKGVRYRSLNKSAGRWSTFLYRWFSATAKEYEQGFRPMARVLESVADRIWRRGAKQKTLESRAVILAAGGFIMNKSMIRELCPNAVGLATLGTAGDDGSGIQLGQSVGAAVSHTDRVSAWRFIYAPQAFLEGVIVSPSGERIAAEDKYGATICGSMITHAGGKGYLILDSAQWNKVKDTLTDQTHGLWKTLVRYLIHFGHKKAETLKDLARSFDIAPGTMYETIKAYNDAITNKQPDPERKLDYRSPIVAAPFYGIDISVKDSGILLVPAITLGGLRVDGASGVVLKEANGDGETIPGLYAAGRNAVGICSNNYVTGLSLADCVFSGKRAGENAGLYSSGSSP